MDRRTRGRRRRGTPPRLPRAAAPGPRAPVLWDTGWTALALLFAERLLAGGRWREAVGLALSAGLQLAGSPYALLGASAASLPILGWMLAHHGIRKLRAGPCLLVAAGVGLAGLAVFAPFFELREAGRLASRPVQVVLRWSQLLPGAPWWSGWPLLALALAGLQCAHRFPVYRRG